MGSAWRVRAAIDSSVVVLLLAALASVYSLDQRKGNAVIVHSPGEPSVDKFASSLPNEPPFANPDLLLGAIPGQFTASNLPEVLPNMPVQGIPGLENVVGSETLQNLKPLRPLLPGSTRKEDSKPDPIPGPMSPKPRQVEFFKIQVVAESVVFVVDCSGSMNGTKFEQARAELARSIANLQSGQSFYVVFFNNTYIPIFDSKKPPAMIKASSAMKAKALSWLSTAFASGGTNPEPALLIAARLKPDVIYLLTDGSFRPLNGSTYQEFARQRTVVNTLGFGDQSDEAVLRQIADQTGGRYRFVSDVDSTANLYLAPADQIRDSLASPSVDVRKLAIEVILARDLPMVSEIVRLLADQDPLVRKTTHDALVNIATGSDFGPDDDQPENRAGAVARWELWAKRRTSLGAEQAAKDLLGDDENKCWVAVAIARQRKLGLPDELIKCVAHLSVAIRHEARAALVGLSEGVDFGPDATANDAAIQEAALKWAEWRADELVKLAAERAKAREARAAQILRLAKMLIDNDRKEAGQQKLTELIRDFPETKAVDEARLLLAQ